MAKIEKFDTKGKTWETMSDNTTIPRPRRALSVMLTDDERAAVDAAAGLSADPHRGKRDGSTSAWARRVLLAAAERIRTEGQ